MKQVCHIIVSDVHGDAGALERALSNIGYSEESDILMSLGNIIDGGRFSKECLEVFARAGDRGRNPVLIARNHEWLLLRALLGYVSDLGPAFGSQATLASYGYDVSRIDLFGNVLRVDGKPIRTAEDVEEFLAEVFGERHLSLLRTSTTRVIFKQFYDGLDGFLCHAGLIWGVPVTETAPSSLVRGDERWVRQRTHHRERLVIIHGRWHAESVVVRCKAICLALSNAVAAMSTNEHIVATSDGRMIEIDRQQLEI